MNTVLKIEFLSNILSQIKGCFLTGSHNTRKARRNDGIRTSSSRKCGSKKNERTPNRGFWVNHKRIQRLMNVLGLTARIRRKRKYSSHKGDIGKKADNLDSTPV